MPSSDVLCGVRPGLKSGLPHGERFTAPRSDDFRLTVISLSPLVPTHGRTWARRWRVEAILRGWSRAQGSRPWADVGPLPVCPGPPAWWGTCAHIPGPASSTLIYKPAETMKPTAQNHDENCVLTFEKPRE